MGGLHPDQFLQGRSRRRILLHQGAQPTVGGTMKVSGPIMETALGATQSTRISRLLRVPCIRPAAMLAAAQPRAGTVRAQNQPGARVVLEAIGDEGGYLVMRHQCKPTQ